MNPLIEEDQRHLQSGDLLGLPGVAELIEGTRNTLKPKS